MVWEGVWRKLQGSFQTCLMTIMIFFRGYPETLQAIKAVKQERAPFQRSISEAPRQMNEKQNTGAHEI